MGVGVTDPITPECLEKLAHAEPGCVYAEPLEQAAAEIRRLRKELDAEQEAWVTAIAERDAVIMSNITHYEREQLRAEIVDLKQQLAASGAND